MPALLASLGASSAMLGLIEGVADGFSSFAKLAIRRLQRSTAATKASRRRRLPGDGGGNGEFRLRDQRLGGARRARARMGRSRGARTCAQRAARRSHDPRDLRPGVRLRARDGQRGRRTRPGTVRGAPCDVGDAPAVPGDVRPGHPFRVRHCFSRARAARTFAGRNSAPFFQDSAACRATTAGSSSVSASRDLATSPTRCSSYSRRRLGRPASVSRARRPSR